jgi:hypothetical protein
MRFCDLSAELHEAGAAKLYIYDADGYPDLSSSGLDGYGIPPEPALLAAQWVTRHTMQARVPHWAADRAFFRLAEVVIRSQRSK